MSLLPIHIIAGALGLVSGSIALFALKGAKLHRRAGIIFVYAMIVMSASGAVMATLKPNRGNQMGGVMAFYLVITGLLTIRRRVAGFDWKDIGAMLVALILGIAGLAFGLEALRSATGTKDGYPAAFYFIYAAMALLAVVGDIRMMLASGRQGARRIARHLWRMCLATFIASGSFFLGQAQVFPKPIRVLPLLAIPALLPLVLMCYWLSRVLRTRRNSSWQP